MPRSSPTQRWLAPEHLQRDLDLYDLPEFHAPGHIYEAIGARRAVVIGQGSRLATRPDGAQLVTPEEFRQSCPLGSWPPALGWELKRAGYFQVHAEGRERVDQWTFGGPLYSLYQAIEEAVVAAGVVRPVSVIATSIVSVADAMNRR